MSDLCFVDTLRVLLVSCIVSMFLRKNDTHSGIRRNDLHKEPDHAKEMVNEVREQHLSVELPLWRSIQLRSLSA